MPTLTGNQQLVDAMKEAINLVVITDEASRLDQLWYTQPEKDKLANITAAGLIDLDQLNLDLKAEIDRSNGVNLIPGDLTSPDPDLKIDHNTVHAPLINDVVQTIPADPLTSNEYATFSSLAAILNVHDEGTMMDKGPILDINDIVETGIYHGLDVINAPITGGIMVLANKDALGNFMYLLLGADGILHVGGKPVGHSIFFTPPVDPNGDLVPISEGSIELDAEYGGDKAVGLLSTFSGHASYNLLDGGKHYVNFIIKPGTTFLNTSDHFVGLLNGLSVSDLFGSGGPTTKEEMEDWVANGSLVEISYSPDGTFHVISVYGYHAHSTKIPVYSDGSVDMDAIYVAPNPQSVMTRREMELVTNKNAFHSGIVPPDPTLGNDGDIYLLLKP